MRTTTMICTLQGQEQRLWVRAGRLILGQLMLVFLADAPAVAAADRGSNSATPLLERAVKVGAPLVAAPPTYNVSVVLGIKTKLIGWTEYDPDTCEPLGPGGWNIPTQPQYGKVEAGLIVSYLGNGDCPGIKFQFAELYYTWTDKSSSSTADTFQAAWTSPDGVYIEPGIFNLTLAQLLITAPATNEQDPANQVSLASVGYFAEAAGDDTISWTADTTYTTSTGAFTFMAKPDVFTSAVNIKTTRSYVSQGGQVVVNASSTTHGSAAPITYYVTGTAIDNAVITSRVTKLYSENGVLKDPTRALLLGVIFQESSCAQFNPNLTLFGTQARWPTENPPSTNAKQGEYIGLMQVPNSMVDAWSWERNTTDGVAVYTDKLRYTLTYQAKEEGLYAGLGGMSVEQFEDVALLMYGGFAKVTGTVQYAIPHCTGTQSGTQCTGGKWVWITRPTLSVAAANYINTIRGHMSCP